MNLEKFTDRAKGFLQSAQTVAIRMSHQRIAPEHLLKALLEDEQGMASGLIKASGGDPGVALRATDAALAKIPAVSGGGAWLLARQPDGSGALVDLFAVAARAGVTCAGSAAIDAAPWAGAAQTALSPDVFLSRDVPAAARAAEKARVSRACPAK